MVSAAAVEAIQPYVQYLSRLPSEVTGDFECFEALLVKWQKAQNLVSRETLTSFWTRHVVDSLQLLRRLEPSDATFLDLGSGGGFPAIPLAIGLKEGKQSFRLIESNQRKVAFLRAVARELDLAVKVDARRVEEIDSRETGPIDVITSRALASLDVLAGLAQPFFGPDTRAIFHKGREYGEELTEARTHWQFDVVVIPSDTSSDGVLLEIRHLRAIPDA